MKNLIVLLVTFTIITSLFISSAKACSCVRDKGIPTSYLENPSLHIKIKSLNNYIEEKTIPDTDKSIRYNIQEITDYDIKYMISNGGYEEIGSYFKSNLSFIKTDKNLFNNEYKIIRKKIFEVDKSKLICSCEDYSLPYSYLNTKLQEGKEYILFIEYIEDSYMVRGIVEVINQRIFNQFYRITPNSPVSFLYTSVKGSIELRLKGDYYTDLFEISDDEKEKPDSVNDDNLEESTSHESSTQNNASKDVSNFNKVYTIIVLLIMVSAIIFLSKEYKIVRR